MTARQIFEAALIETNKAKAPALILSDYNYLINKSINQYINIKYNFYDLNQQIDDDLDAIRVLDYPIDLTLGTLYYKGTLPDDYLHILNCSVKFNILTGFKCYNIGDNFIKPASRLRSSPAKRVEENYYFKASYNNPYFYRNNDSLEIRSGNVDLAEPIIAYIDYLKTPEIILLTQDQLDSVIDTSQILEFPDYVVQEIINIFSKLLFENGSDPRLQTHIPINNSIINPGQQSK